jgi:hypothetical protein
MADGGGGGVCVFLINFNRALPYPNILRPFRAETSK